MKKKNIKTIIILTLVSTLALGGVAVVADKNNSYNVEARSNIPEAVSENEDNAQLLDDNMARNETKMFLRARAISNKTYTQTVEDLGNGLNVINTDWDWKYPLNYTNKPKTIVLHHAAEEKLSAIQVHQIHQNLDWTGIGYHFYVTKDGAIYRGRPEDARGAHAYFNNVDSIGISCEGNYDVNPNFPEAQRKSIEALIKYLKNKYPEINRIGGHEETPENVGWTVCPGKYYPLQDIKKASGILGN